MNKERKKNIAEQFKEEEAKSVQFMQKLTQIKKSNKESKERTVISQHKLEWFKQFRSNQKREYDCSFTWRIGSNSRKSSASTASWPSSIPAA